ncbi:DNA (cytosine-5)-methyltransferase 1 [Pseudomonas sp. TE3786]
MDFFSGSGSVTAALKMAGYRVAAALDIDEGAAATFRANHPEVNFFREDIRNLTPSQLAAVAPHEGVDLLAICAPCQPFSSQNRKRTKKDKRIPLLLETIPFIKALSPQSIWIENVPGLGSTKIIPRLQKELKTLGYHFDEPMRIDAADLGVPQRRIRFVFMASRNKDVCSRFSSLLPSTSTRKNVRMAFKGLKPLAPGEVDQNDPLHAARRHSEITLRRLEAIPSDGGSRSSLPLELQLECHKNLSENSFPDVYGRMSWNAPSPTLTTGCTDVTRGRFAHPEENRAITLREAARLQTFPDSYIFCGNRTQIALQIGNAVPMTMAYEIFKRVSVGEPLHGLTKGSRTS